jgi:hypothetical protein
MRATRGRGLVTIEILEWRHARATRARVRAATWLAALLVLALSRARSSASTSAVLPILLMGLRRQSCRIFGRHPDESRSSNPDMTKPGKEMCAAPIQNPSFAALAKNALRVVSA